MSEKDELSHIVERLGCEVGDLLRPLPFPRDRYTSDELALIDRGVTLARAVMNDNDDAQTAPARPTATDADYDRWLACQRRHERDIINQERRGY